MAGDPVVGEPVVGEPVVGEPVVGDTAVVTFKVFGTTAVLLLTEPAAADRAMAIANAQLAAVDLACNRFRPDSELSRLNASHGALTHVSELFACLIAEALRAAELTDGDVDPTCGQALVHAGYDKDFGELSGGPIRSGAASPVPGWRNVRLDQASRTVQLTDGAQLDLGSTAKAWSADRCADLIAAELGVGVLVSLGGDIAVAGPPPGDGWQVKTTDDHSASPGDAEGQTVTISSGGLATSSTTVRAWEAGGRRMHHIIDPRTGEPAASLWRTVSVAAATCVDANIASTAAIIRSEAAPAWLTDLALPARLVSHDGTVTTTTGWPSPSSKAAP